jgi:zinc transport system ATP-binding protein
MSDGPALMRCEGLQVGYAGKALLPPIDLEIHPGEFWAVLGRNGSGKSTWFKTALGLLPPVAGAVRWPSGEVPVSYLAQRMSFDELFPVTVAEVVGMARMRGWSFLRPAGAGAAVRRALEEVDAVELARRTFRSLSEGQKQRVLIARTVAAGARLAFLDEPTAAMDAVAEGEAMALVDRLRSEHDMAVVIVSHHLGVARRFATRALFVDDDSDTVIVGSADEVFAHPAFTRRYGARAVS